MPAPAQVVEARGRALAPAPGQAPANSAGREINKPAQTLICNDSKRWRDRDAERDKTTERGRHGGYATNNGSSEGTLTCTAQYCRGREAERAGPHRSRARLRFRLWVGPLRTVQRIGETSMAAHIYAKSQRGKDADRHIQIAKQRRRVADRDRQAESF